MSTENKFVIEQRRVDGGEFWYESQLQTPKWWGHAGSYDDQIATAVVDEAKEMDQTYPHLQFRVVKLERSYSKTLVHEFKKSTA